uniref:glucan endo-1,3-beta-D-glucosidase n=3 Tax=Brassica TaxID=3705 RepID=A0A0D3CV95_BRAOL
MMMMITTQYAFGILLIFSMASSSTIPSLGGPGIGTNYGRYSSNLGGNIYILLRIPIKLIDSSSTQLLRLFLDRFLLSRFFNPVPEIGINYGRYGSNLPPPEALPSLVTSLSIKHVKTFDMDPRITTSFANTGISLSLCIPNDKIPILSTNLSEADSIIRTFILPYHKTTIITSISVGNEVSLLPQFTPHLVSAVVNVHRAIKRYRLHKKIKVTTTHSLAILSRRFPPSTARFHNSIGESVLKPLVRFLQRTKSPLMVNVYPYLAYKQSFPSIPLDFALFQPVNGSKRRMYRDPYSGVAYTNLFDIMMDSVDSAVKALGLPKIPVVVSEIGWPSSGDPGEVAASLENARVFNQRLVEHLRRGEKKVTVYIFALFDEDQKTGATVEKHWGLLYGNGSRKYDLNISPPV